MNDKSDSETSENHVRGAPERPLECSECTRPLTVRYTEVVNQVCTEMSMCSQCPELQKRLRGGKEFLKPFIHSEGGAELVCGDCGTTMESVRVGIQVGCSHCYEVFQSLLVDELVRCQALSARLIDTKRSQQVLHLGRSPGEKREIPLSMRLLALNEALNETLAHEEYEQAALLRDQIRAITEGKGGTS